MELPLQPEFNLFESHSLMRRALREGLGTLIDLELGSWNESFLSSSSSSSSSSIIENDVGPESLLLSVENNVLMENSSSVYEESLDNYYSNKNLTKSLSSTPPYTLDMVFNDAHLLSIITYSCLFIFSATGEATVNYLRSFL